MCRQAVSDDRDIRQPSKEALIADRLARSVYVRNLPSDISMEVFLKTFEKVGPIRSVFVKDPQKGVGFVDFETPDVAQRCLEIAKVEPFIVNDKILHVEERRDRHRAEGADADASNDVTASDGAHGAGSSGPGRRPGAGSGAHDRRRSGSGTGFRRDRRSATPN